MSVLCLYLTANCHRMVAARAATELGQQESTSSKVGGSDDPQTGRGFSYIHYEANSWEATFSKSGTLYQMLHCSALA